MSLWSSRRQLSYLLIPLVIVVVGGIFFYKEFIYHSPTCFDNIQNGDETGVDCGGSCSLVCSNQTLAPVVVWAKSFNVTGNVYNAVAYVENPNPASSAFNVPYTFDLYDVTGNLITSQSGTSNILKGSSFAVFAADIAASSTVVRTDFSFAQGISWVKDTTTPITWNIVHDPLAATTTAPKLSGTIRNPSLVSIPPAQLVALIFDGRQNVIGASKTEVPELSGGQSAPFVFTWQHPFPAGVDACTTPSDIMLVLDRSGSMESEGSNPPEPLTDVKQTAADFVDDLQYGDAVGIISFGSHASLLSPTVSNFNQVKTAINNLSIATDTAENNTNIGDALTLAGGSLTSSDGNKKVIILLTDGVPTAPASSTASNYPTLYAQSEAENLRMLGDTIFTVGLGSQVNQQILETIAGSPSHFFLAPTTATLAGIYHSIADSICERKPNVIEILSEPIYR